MRSYVVASEFMVVVEAETEQDAKMQAYMKLQATMDSAKNANRQSQLADDMFMIDEESE